MISVTKLSWSILSNRRYARHDVNDQSGGCIATGAIQTRRGCAGLVCYSTVTKALREGGNTSGARVLDGVHGEDEAGSSPQGQQRAQLEDGELPTVGRGFGRARTRGSTAARRSCSAASKDPSTGARTREKQRRSASTARSERPEFLSRPNTEGSTNPRHDGGHSQAEGRGCAQRSSATSFPVCHARLKLLCGGAS